MSDTEVTTTETTETPTETTTTETPAVEKAIPVKVDGQTETLTRKQILERLSQLPDEELASAESIRAASMKRMDLAARQLREANQEKQTMADFKAAMAADDPDAIEEALGKMGVDARKAAEKVLWKHYQREKATPQQRKEMDLNEREKRIQAQERARQEAEQSQLFQQQVEELYEQLSEEVTGLFEQAGVELDEETTAELVPRVAYHIDAVRQATGHMPTTHEVVDFIRKIDAKRGEKSIAQIMGKLEAGDLSGLSPKAKEAVRKALVAEYAKDSPNEPTPKGQPKSKPNGKDMGPPVFKADDLDSWQKTFGR